MDAFLELFGHYKIADVVILFTALAFVYGIYVKVRDGFVQHYEQQKEKDEMLKTALDEISKYPEYQKQNEKIQKQLTNAIDNISTKQDEFSKRLEEIEVGNKKRELNKIRDRLLQSYKYYTSTDKNPLQAWTIMESDAFWEMFGDYEELGGDGYMHTVVEPAMRQLSVIEMTDAKGISHLMSSRK